MMSASKAGSSVSDCEFKINFRCSEGPCILKNGNHVQEAQTVDWSDTSHSNHMDSVHDIYNASSDFA